MGTSIAVAGGWGRRRKFEVEEFVSGGVDEFVSYNVEEWHS